MISQHHQFYISIFRPRITNHYNLPIFMIFDNMDASNNTTAFQPCITLSQIHFYVDFSWWLSGVGTIFISTLGMIFNAMAIYILCDKRMCSSFFNRLLVCLAIIDNLFLANAIFVVVVEKLIESPSADHLFIFVNFLYPTRNMFMCCSIYMTVGLACERFNSTSNPFLHRTRQNESTCRRLLLYVLPVITFSVVYNIPKFFDLKILERPLDFENSSNCSQSRLNDTSQSQCEIRTEFYTEPTKIRNNEAYILWYINVSNLIVTSVIPLLLLTYFNYKIYTALKERQKRKANMVSQPNNTSGRKEHSKKENRQTFVLFAIVVLFVICHALRVILNIAEFLEKYNVKQQGCTGKSFWTIVSIPIAACLLQLNSGTNFFVYCVLSDLFREVLRSKLPLKRPFSNQNGFNAQIQTTQTHIELRQID